MNFSLKGGHSVYTPKIWLISPIWIYSIKTLMILSWFLLSSMAISQQKRIDSLENLIKNMRQDSNYVEICVQLSYSYNNSSFEKTKEWAERAIAISEKISFGRGISHGYSQLGQLFYRKGLYDLATENHLKALNISEGINDHQETGRIYNNLGNVYLKQKQYDLALDYYRKSINIKRGIGDSGGISNTYKNIAAVYIELNIYDSSLIFLSKALKIADSTGDLRVLGDIYNYMGDTYAAIRDKNLADKYYFKAIEVAQNINDDYGVAKSYNGLGFLAFKFENYNRAIEYFLSALNQTEKLRINFEKSRSYLGLYECYSVLNNFKEANKYLKQYEVLKDSLFGERVLTNISVLKSKYEFAKKENELMLLAKEKQLSDEKVSNLFTVIIFSVIFFAALLIFLFLLSRNRSKIKKQANEIKIANDTKDKLFSIIAHDLRNPVGNITNMIKVMEEERDTMTDDDLAEFISLLRDNAEKTYELLENLLQWTMSQSNKIIIKPREYEINRLIDENIAALSGIARAKSIKLHSNISGKIIAIFDWNTINTALRNLIANALKFTGSEGEISVSAKAEKGFVEIIVKDNGIGMSEEKRKILFAVVSTTKGTKGEKGTGLGLTLCKEFVERNGGKIRVESEMGKGSKFIFTVPLARNSS